MTLGITQQEEHKCVGILGGLGPAETAYFFEMLIAATDAETDQDNVDAIILNYARIPDRSAYILGRSNISPLGCLIEGARKLEQAGCDYVVIPCNTAHFFYCEIQNTLTIPLLNIIHEGVYSCYEQGAHCVGVLCTEGTRVGGMYEHSLNRMGMECRYPDENTQKHIDALIYQKVKAGKPVLREELLGLYRSLIRIGCDTLILGCTELSVAHSALGLDCPYVIDSLQSLAVRSVVLSGCAVKPAASKKM